MSIESRAGIIIGLGYVGRHLLAALKGWGLATLSRSSASSLPGVDHRVGDLDQPDQLPRLDCSDKTLFYLAPPPTTGVTDPRLKALLKHIAQEPPARMIYISTTGVYGDCGGAWVDEQQPTNPSTDRARRRLDAEVSLSTFCQTHDVPLVILRVAGIYGPGRLPLARLRAGKPILALEESPYSNRIHVADLVQVLVATAADEAPTGIFNVSDGHPTSMGDYFCRVAAAVGLPQPPTISRVEMGGQLTPEMQSYMNESRRLDNGRIREELGITLRYSELEDGLRASLSPEDLV